MAEAKIIYRRATFPGHQPHPFIPVATEVVVCPDLAISRRQGMHGIFSGALDIYRNFVSPHRPMRSHEAAIRPNQVIRDPEVFSFSRVLGLKRPIIGVNPRRVQKSGHLLLTTDICVHVEHTELLLNITPSILFLA